MFDSKGRNIHYLRLSVTDLCNLRCRYCMPDGVDKLEREDILTYEEFLRLAALFARCGVDTVRVTGGEPLVRRGVEQLVKGLKAIPGIRKVTMTTNAVLLEQQLPALLEAGLDSVNISLDTLDPALFAKITARDEFAAVQAGIHAALESGIPVKLNCVPQVGVNEGELEALAALAQDKPLQVRFIEMMPIGYGAAMPCISGPELLARFRRRWPELAPLPGAACAALGDGPAVYYTVPGWKGDIGFIAAVHGKFCASCNRVRLTSQGFLRPCLASETGCDLKALLRSGAPDEELLTAIRTTIWEKPQEHHFELKQDIPRPGVCTELEDKSMGKLLAICTSPQRGTVKTEVESARLTPEWGIETDAHGGNWHRQVSLLSAEKIENFRKKIWVDYGAFGENLVVEGYDFRNLPVTSRFAIGDVVLEMTQIGKECHNDCVIKQKTGECIMPREGVFARVLQGGEIHVGTR